MQDVRVEFTHIPKVGGEREKETKPGQNRLKRRASVDVETRAAVLRQECPFPQRHVHLLIRERRAAPAASLTPRSEVTGDKCRRRVGENDKGVHVAVNHSVGFGSSRDKELTRRTDVLISSERGHSWLSKKRKMIISRARSRTAHGSCTSALPNLGLTWNVP